MKYKILLLLCITISCSNKEKKSYPNNVGDIEFNPKIDNPNFKPCNEEYAFVHYNFGQSLIYKGEKPALVKQFNKLKFPKTDNINGYITVRFMVNCNGKTGRFRIEQLDHNYEAKKFNDALVNSIVSTTKNLDGWIPASYNGDNLDYYKYLTFKIKDNQIIDILP